MKFNNKTKADLLADLIIKRIASGEYPAGHQLPPDDQMIDNFEFSRTTSREAYRTIKSLGMIESKAKRGTIVLPRSQWNLLDKKVISAVTGASESEINSFINKVTEMQEYKELFKRRNNVSLITSGVAGEQYNNKEAAEAIQITVSSDISASYN